MTIQVAEHPILLSGSPFERGRQQAQKSSDKSTEVRSVVRLRLDAAGDRLAKSATRAFLAEQRRYTDECYPAALEELRGLAEGFDILEDDLFAYQHLALIEDILGDGQPVAGEGCTTWAATHPHEGSLLAKNRDTPRENRFLQRVFHQVDPKWGGREVMSVGSLGGPPANSSGINTAGLALADTAVSTTDHGVGLLRYFLMGRLLAECSTVLEALELINNMTHAGGGTLVLTDAAGTIAAVELGHDVVSPELHYSGVVARTNHFVSSTLEQSNRENITNHPAASESRARLENLLTIFGTTVCPWDHDAAATVLASHGESSGVPFCRHCQNNQMFTISAATYYTLNPQMHFSDGPPCNSRWNNYVFDVDNERDKDVTID